MINKKRRIGRLGRMIIEDFVHSEKWIQFQNDFAEKFQLTVATLNIVGNFIFPPSGLHETDEKNERTKVFYRHGVLESFHMKKSLYFLNYNGTFFRTLPIFVNHQLLCCLAFGNSPQFQITDDREFLALLTDCSEELQLPEDAVLFFDKVSRFIKKELLRSLAIVEDSGETEFFHLTITTPTQEQLKDKEFMEKCEQFLQVEAFKDYTLADIASFFHLSESGFRNKFKRQTGISWRDFTKSIRFKQIKVALRETDMSLSEIAEKYGFSDTSSLYRLMKEKTGFSPNDYRTLEREVFYRNHRYGLP
ncbi:MAG: AraC family transcriptional regulator [Lactobacillales bacterium]|nr:AraC family transcriptional regulator [Lactobacillales bacterium]